MPYDPLRSVQFAVQFDSLLHGEVLLLEFELRPRDRADRSFFFSSEITSSRNVSGRGRRVCYWIVDLRVFAT